MSECPVETFTQSEISGQDIQKGRKLFHEKWITIDAFIVAFLSAMGSAFGYSIPAMFNVPGWLCMVISIAAGLVMEEIGNKIIYNRFTQEKPWRKINVIKLR